MRSSDDNLPPDGPGRGTGPGGEPPYPPYEEQPYGEPPYAEQPYGEQPYREPVSLEDAEERLRNFGALSDTGASFPVPDEEVVQPRRRGGRHGKGRKGRAYREERRPELHEDAYYGDYSRPRSSGVRWALRIAVPIVFLGGIIAIVLVVLNSGILGGEAGTSASPSVSASASPVIQTIYKVKKGDTLSAIAIKFGVSVEDILAANPKKIDLANNLSVGTKLKIPAKQE